MRLFERYRQNRLWNINGNIMLASVSGELLTALVIQATNGLIDDHRVIVIATIIVSAILDALIYAALHLLMHHRAFFKDVMSIQVQRWFLSPLFYSIGAGFQWFLLSLGVARGATVLVAYLTALLVTRGVHTWYGLRTGLFMEEDTDGR
ncbi:hypothetical protein D6789_00745 [Candidatus Woesearchaeota archaeon]|nr:MAG: hypothetical protein D6789_00745 [Candidatus Woesearchaeota archaeon]